MSKSQYITDKEDGDMHQGYSLKNGKTIGTVDAYLYIGGTNELKFYGFVKNCGEIYSNAGMQIAGWCDMPSGAISSDTAIINFKNAKAHFGGGVNLNSNAFTTVKMLFLTVTVITLTVQLQLTSVILQFQAMLK